MECRVSETDIGKVGVAIFYHVSEYGDKVVVTARYTNRPHDKMAVITYNKQKNKIRIKVLCSKFDTQALKHLIVKSFLPFLTIPFLPYQ